MRTRKRKNILLEKVNEKLADQGVFIKESRPGKTTETLGRFVMYDMRTGSIEALDQDLKEVAEGLGLIITKCTSCERKLPQVFYSVRLSDERIVPRYCRDCMVKQVKERLKKRGGKCCKRCKSVLPLEQFYRNAVTHDGLQHNCKACTCRSRALKYEARRKRKTQK